MSLRSVPPPPPSTPAEPVAEPRRPGLARAGALPYRLASRDVVQQWRQRRRVSDRDLLCVLRAASQSRVNDMSRGDAPFPLELLFALPERDALELLRDVEDAIRARRLSA